MIVAAVVGLSFGALCAALRLPLPAPQSAAGVVAVVALWIGWSIVSAVR